MTLLLPTDGCENCITIEKGAPVHPWLVLPDEHGTGIFAWYTCPSCGHSWRTGWAAEAVNLPCPGCPECPAVEAGAA